MLTEQRCSFRHVSRCHSLNMVRQYLCLASLDMPLLKHDLAESLSANLGSSAEHG